MATIKAYTGYNNKYNRIYSTTFNIIDFLPSINDSIKINGQTGYVKNICETYINSEQPNNKIKDYKYYKINIFNKEQRNIDFKNNSLKTRNNYMENLYVAISQGVEEEMETTQKGIRYEYEIINDNEVKITGAELGEATELELSDLEIAGKSYAVTEIGDNAFYHCTSLKGATFPKVTTIGDSAFAECKSLEGATFPEATYIDISAFAFCESLEGASFPKVTTISKSAFEYCDSLKEASFPEATEIGENAFFNCRSLKGASIPKATELGNSAFSECDSLKEASFPEVTEIGEFAFACCESLEGATFPRVTYIGDFAFAGCTSLKEASFPEATELGDFTFSKCKNLEELVTPKVEKEVASEEQREAKSLSQQPISI